jgi:hypothetical protein
VSRRPARYLPGFVRIRDDRGSLLVAILLSLIGISLSTLLMPIVLTQINSTKSDVRRSVALNAAQAGLDVAVGHIRAADDGTGHGVLGQLPCGPLSGAVEAGPARYQVLIDYIGSDPQGKSDAWITANRIGCISGGGTFSTPSFALLRSRGTDQAGGNIDTVPARTLKGTYLFKTTNQNIVGGLIHIYKTPSTDDLCMDASSGSPTAGTNLQMRPCNPGSVQQLFAYNQNLTLTLISSRTAANPLGMCLDAGLPQGLGNIVAFRPCSAVTSARQQWSMNDSANFEGTTDGQTLNGYCFNVQSPDVSGSFVVLGSRIGGTCGKGYDNIETFNPEASAGAGAAGPAVNQTVNFDQFGRCLDVTEFKLNYAYLIVWPCKQAPNPTLVAWNQRFTLPALTTDLEDKVWGPITVNPGAGTLYCLQSPGSVAAGSYVQPFPCPAYPPANMQWTANGATGDYDSSYRIEDRDGHCLSPTDPDAAVPDLYPKGLRISKLVVADCSNSLLQKWNADPNILHPQPLKDITEI